MDLNHTPKKLEQKLIRQAHKKGLTGKAFGRYVYGIMQEKTDWKPGKKRYIK